MTDIYQKRRQSAVLRREQATELAFSETKRPSGGTKTNTDNSDHHSLPMAFTKGLAHDELGFSKKTDFEKFSQELDHVDSDDGSPSIEFEVPLAKDANLKTYCKVEGSTPGYRTWESPLAGHYFSLEGADPDNLSLAPPASLGSSELVAEIAEVYAMSVTRDMTFEELSTLDQPLYYRHPDGSKFDYFNSDGSKSTVNDLIDALNHLPWFRDSRSNPSEIPNRRNARGTNGKLSAKTLFRGSTPGTTTEEYISRFLTMGSGDESNPREKGIIGFGSQTIDQRVLPGKPGIDYMTSWEEWLDVQNGVDLSGRDVYDEKRLIERPRDLAQYVHIDQLYQAYFNACLILLQGNSKIKDSPNLFSHGFPNNVPNRPTRGAFASFGAPHLLSLLPEVASRALKAVRRQKFQFHRRARPERLAAMLTLAANGHTDRFDSNTTQALQKMLAELGLSDDAKSMINPIALWVNQYNDVQNSEEIRNSRRYSCAHSTDKKLPHIAAGKNFMLPMAFPEGSPMHPSYGAGHATVAGACVTVLKAFFELRNSAGALAPMSLIGDESPDLTIEGELNKLASNISIGRNFAGVHYYSDYFDSLRMGERIAASIIEEQMLNYSEPVSMSFGSFDNDFIEIGTNGGPLKTDVTFTVNGDHSDPSVAAWWTRHVDDDSTNSQLKYA